MLPHLTACWLQTQRCWQQRRAGNGSPCIGAMKCGHEEAESLKRNQTKPCSMSKRHLMPLRRLKCNSTGTPARVPAQTQCTLHHSALHELTHKPPHPAAMSLPLTCAKLTRLFQSPDPAPPQCLASQPHTPGRLQSGQGKAWITLS